MNKFWQVALHEFRLNALKKRFILVLLSLPLIITLNLAIGLFMESLQEESRPVGYVDQAGVLVRKLSPPIRPGAEPVEFRPFDTEESARRALASQEIDAYYVLGPDYEESRHIELFYNRRPSGSAIGRFFDFLQVNLVEGQPQQIARRIAAGAEVTVRSPDGRRSVSSGGPTFGLLMPLLINLAFLALLLISSGYLMGALAEEKENRTMEILATSISPLQLIAGKITGIVALGLTLFLSWSAIAFIGLSSARALGLGWFQDLSMDWRIIAATATIALPAYVLVAALMVDIGSMVTSTQEGQSLSTLFIALHLAPLYVSVLFVNEPNAPLATVMSLLPFTALMAVAMRSLGTVVPVWQIALSAAVQVVCALVAVWLASRAFRLGMLQYGQRLSWRRLLRRREMVNRRT